MCLGLQQHLRGRRDRLNASGHVPVRNRLHRLWMAPIWVSAGAAFATFAIATFAAAAIAIAADWVE